MKPLMKMIKEIALIIVSVVFVNNFVLAKFWDFALSWVYPKRRRPLSGWAQR